MACLSLRLNDGHSVYSFVPSYALSAESPTEKERIAPAQTALCSSSALEKPRVHEDQ